MDSHAVVRHSECCVSWSSYRIAMCLQKPIAALDTGVLPYEARSRGKAAMDTLNFVRLRQKCYKISCWRNRFPQDPPSYWEREKSVGSDVVPDFSGRLI